MVSVSVNIGIFWSIGIGIGIGWIEKYSIGIGIGKNNTDPPSLNRLHFQRFEIYVMKSVYEKQRPVVLNTQYLGRSILSVVMED